MNYLAGQLRYARHTAQLSQKELGEKLGVSEMAISAYETGRATPPLPALKKISKITKLPVAYFIEEGKQQVSLESLDKDMQHIKKNLGTILKLLKNYEK